MSKANAPPVYATGQRVALAARSGGLARGEVVQITAVRPGSGKNGPRYWVRSQAGRSALVDEAALGAVQLPLPPPLGGE